MQEKPSGLSSPDPAMRRAALDQWALAHPYSVDEISRLLKDPDPSVRKHARSLWNTALSGGRASEPE